jgi:tetratricopeptide (TPR) repeat protein
VRARRGPRPARDPAAEQARIEQRTIERWEIDDDLGGLDADLRGEASQAARRAGGAGVRPPRRFGSPVPPEVAAEIAALAPDRRVADRAVARFGQAQDALDRDRLTEARQLIGQVLKAVPGLAAAHEIAGLVAYRSGRWRDAVRELTTAQEARPNIALLPVIADSYRALRRWNDVERLWLEIRQVSPSQDVMAEARIVAAGAQADRGDLAGALQTMAGVPASPKRVRDHHLRQWYVLGDLHDRAGNTLDATRWFERVAGHDPRFVDVAARLRALGRPR